jgi:DnaK suppressor protein
MHEEAKEILLKMKEELIEEIAANMKVESDVLKSEIGDTFDLAVDERDREMTLLLCDRDQEKLIAIEEVLKKIKDGTYGICEECGKEINKARLKAMPFAKLCVSCKSRIEKYENDKMRLYKPDIYQKLADAKIEDDE